MEDNEAKRLEELYSYQILDTPNEKGFDQLAFLGATLCHAPMALISFVDAQRQWHKSSVGSFSQELPRPGSFCARAIDEEVFFEVQDSHVDPYFSEQPMVREAPFVRFYAGAVLTSPKGFKLGTLCVMDSRARSLSQEEKKALLALASQVVDQLELRRMGRELQGAQVKFKRQQQNLIYAAKMQSLGELAASICHQINNPLTIITGRAMIMRSLLTEPTFSKATFLKELDIVEKTSFRISSILRSLRLYSRDDNDGETTLVNIDQVIIDVLALLKGRFNASGIDVQYEKASEVSLKMNRSHMTQVFLNLLTNSFDAMASSKEKKVNITLDKDEDFAFIKVEDNGRGIDPQDRAYIFQPFFSTKEVGKSSGIGLSLSQDFVKEHGGEILLSSSRSPTTFVIKLPLS